MHFWYILTLHVTYPKEEYEEISRLIYEEFIAFQNRQLPESCIGIFIDGDMPPKFVKL
ncbi:hypothetical protein [Methanocaldococcus sp.]